MGGAVDPLDPLQKLRLLPGPGTKGDLLGEVTNGSIEDIEALVRREAK